MANATPLSTPLPSLGTSAADTQLVAILQRCWNVSDPRQLNGSLAAHRDAFDCARAAFLDLALANPTFALIHRMLAWGYYYKDNNLAKAMDEYRISADLYHRAGDRAGESESRMRVGLLLVSSSRTQACSEFSTAANLNPQNDRATQYYQSYNCGKAVAANPAPGGGQLPSGPGAGPTLPPSVPDVDLASLRGKIVFKSDRGYEGYYAMDADGKNVKPISMATYTAADKWETFSPDHQQVATVRLEGSNRKYGYNNDIWVTDPQGGSGRPLANPANDYDAVWSPAGLADGSFFLAFVSNRGDSLHGDVQGEEIWIMHPDGNKSYRLTCNGPAFSKHPSWSPDAGRIVFYSNAGTGHSQLFLLNASSVFQAADTCDVGKTMVNVSNGASNDSDPIWVK